MTRWMVVMLAGMLSLSGPLGCKKLKKAYDKARGKGASGDSKDIALAKKLRAYIDITNALSSRVIDSKRRYLANFKDAKAGPTCKERRIHPPYTLSNVSRLTKAVEKAQSSKPRLKDLEEGAAKYLAAVHKLEPLLEKAKRYYRQKDWKEDGCKGAKAMHPQLVALFKEFEAGDTQMRKALKKYNLALHYRILEHTAKKHGKTSARYYHMRVPLDAEVLLGLLRIQRKEKKPDVDKVVAEVTKLDALVVAMAEHTAKGKKPRNWKWFLKASDAYIKACKEMMRRLKSGKKFSAHEKSRLSGSTAHWVKGSFAKVLKKYNELVEKTNGVKFR